MDSSRPITGSPRAFQDLAARLAWVYGPERAAAIMVGSDPGTRADLERWRDLGRSKNSR